MGSNFLTGSLPSELGQLSNLENLYLSCNHLDGEIPVELGQLQKLMYFDLSFNYYEGEIPGEIAVLYSLPTLTELDITNNRFSGVIPTSLINHPKWNELVWGIVQQRDGFELERETVKTSDTLITAIDNKTFDLDSVFESNTLTVVFKWSLSDPFSGKFIPVLKTVNENFSNNGLSIVSYIRASTGEVNEIEDYINDNQISWTNLIIDYGAEFANFPGECVPNVHIVNQNREIVFSDQLWDDREDFEQFITAQLGPLNLYESTDLSQDGQIMKLQSATIGKGLNILLLGDGFVDTMMVAGGLYEQKMSEAMEHFFSVEPTKSYREYFNVYLVKAVSKNGVFMDRSETIFSLKFGENRGVSGDLERIKEYARKIEGIDTVETHIITIMNSTGRAGTTYMYDDGSVALISMPSDIESFAGLLQHESVGHGLGKLGDEYIDHYETITQAEQDHLIELHLKGWYQNISLSQTNPPWSHFIGHPNYTMVGTFEGGFYYWKGVWRPEETSSMVVSKLGYFNGPGREQIVKHTLEAAGVTYSWDDFVAKDKYEPALKSAIIIDAKREQETEPLSPPVIMNKKLFER
ncbi:MAG: M64 family metallopeptidase [Bacteroidales bacterium]|nr:M64 family metallopeptidase [Bacteroidales bacterium]